MKRVSFAVDVLSDGAAGVDLGTVSVAGGGGWRSCCCFGRRGSRRCLALLLAYLTCMALFGVAAVFKHSSGREFSLEQYFGSHDTGEMELLTWSRRRAASNALLSRRAALDSACARLSHPARAERAAIAGEEPDPTRWFYMKQPDFMMCMIPKVASTTFSSFIIDAHRAVKGGRNNFGFKPGGFKATVSEKTYSAMVVRHPLERLLSAYLYIFIDEVKRDENRTKLYANLTRVLLSAYRSDGADPERDFVTFPEFVRFVVNGTAEKIAVEWSFYPGADPLAWVRDANLNAHWLPYWRACTPCHRDTRPNAVLKLDSPSFRDELKAMLEASGVREYFRSRGLSDLSLPWKNPTAEGKEAADQRRKKYFSQISKSDVMSLYHKYRADHELFGYGIEPYLSLAKSSGNS